MFTRCFASTSPIPRARVWLTAFALLLVPAAAKADQRLPNIILIVCDNLGYGDVEPFNPECLNRTPNLKRQLVAKILALAEIARRDIGDGDQPGQNQRPHGRVENPRPLLPATDS